MGPEQTHAQGRHGNYRWLSGESGDISALLRTCPEIVVGKFLAITNIDSDALILSDGEKRQGWWTDPSARTYTGRSWQPPEYSDGTVVYSPEVTSIHSLPNDTRDEYRGGFNEWYVFDFPPQPQEMEVFMGWGGFRPGDANFQEWTDRLFEQLDRVAAESYIAEGTFFAFATRHADLFQKVVSAFSANRQ